MSQNTDNKTLNNTSENEDNDCMLRNASQSYRTCSGSDNETVYQSYKMYAEEAGVMATTESISYNDAMERIRPSWKKDKWATVVPEAEDSKNGDIITTKSLFVSCNSILNGMYNDTICVFVDKDTNSYVTYLRKSSSNMTHSGDMTITYGLRHEITFSTSELNGKVGYIVSSPWENKRSRPIKELITTRPIFEVCTEDDGVLKRYIIPQDFSQGGDNTACVNAEITFNDGLWKITLKKDYIKGFADDMYPLIKDLRKISKLEDLNTPNDEYSCPYLMFPHEEYFSMVNLSLSESFPSSSASAPYESFPASAPQDSFPPSSAPQDSFPPSSAPHNSFPASAPHNSFPPSSAPHNSFPASALQDSVAPPSTSALQDSVAFLSALQDSVAPPSASSLPPNITKKRKLNDLI
jgi:hypothetical protein